GGRAGRPRGRAGGADHPVRAVGRAHRGVGRGRRGSAPGGRRLVDGSPRAELGRSGLPRLLRGAGRRAHRGALRPARLRALARHPRPLPRRRGGGPGRGRLRGRRRAGDAPGGLVRRSRRRGAGRPARGPRRASRALRHLRRRVPPRLPGGPGPARRPGRHPLGAGLAGTGRPVPARRDLGRTRRVRALPACLGQRRRRVRLARRRVRRRRAGGARPGSGADPGAAPPRRPRRPRRARPGRRRHHPGCLLRRARGRRALPVARGRGRGAPCRARVPPGLGGAGPAVAGRRTGERALPARARRPAAGGRGHGRPGDRSPPVPEPAHRAPAPRERAQQARPALPGGRRGLRGAPPPARAL
ncbi:MAG: Transcriptional regulator, partial [uncultured Actinomycetospora sp.]